MMEGVHPRFVVVFDRSDQALIGWLLTCVLVGLLLATAASRLPREAVREDAPLPVEAPWRPLPARRVAPLPRVAPEAPSASAAPIARAGPRPRREPSAPIGSWLSAAREVDAAGWHAARSLPGREAADVLERHATRPSEPGAVVDIQPLALMDVAQVVTIRFPQGVRVPPSIVGVMLDHLDDFASCRPSKSTVRVHAEWDIVADHVENLVVDDDGRAPLFIGCVRNVIGRWRFLGHPHEHVRQVFVLSYDPTV